MKSLKSMWNYKPHLILAISLFCYFISISEFHAQSGNILWQTQIGGNGSDQIYRTIENNQNLLITAGVTRSFDSKGEDVMVNTLSSEGKILHTWNYGGKANDGAYCIIQTYDGGYLVGGYTQGKWEKSLGKTDGWVLKISSSGEFLWDVILGTDEEDIVHDLAQDIEGDFVIVGETTGQSTIFKLQADGKVLWEQKFNPAPSSTLSVAITRDGNYVCSGVTGRQDNKLGFAACFTPAGKRLWNQTFQYGELNDGTDLIQKKDGGFIITGIANTMQGRKDLYIINMDEKGRSTKPYFYSGHGDDSGLSIVETFDKNFIVTGTSQSYTRGARRSDLLIQKIGQDYKQKWPDPIFIGETLDDGGEDIMQLRSGDILISGYSNSSFGSNGWVMLMEYVKPNQTSQLNSIQFDSAWVFDQNGNDTINALEYNYLGLRINNITNQDLHGAYIRVNKKSLQSGIEVPEYIYFDFIPANTTKTITIPITALKNAVTGTNELVIEILNSENSIMVKVPLDFNSKAMTTPSLQITDGFFTTQDQESLADRLEVIHLKLVLKNEGEGISENTIIRFFCPFKIRPISDDWKEVGEIMPGDSVVVDFKFEASSIYEYDFVSIYCAAFENTSRFGDSHYFRLQIKDFFETTETPQIIIEPKGKQGDPFNQHYGNKGGSEGSVLLSETNTAQTTIIWKAPDPDELGEQFSHPLDYIDLKVSIVSSDTINLADIIVYIDDMPAVEGSQYYKEKIGLNKGPGVNDYRYTYFNKIKLKEGENKVYIMVKGARSPYIYVTYIPERTNLHVFAIGVPHDDLLFTVKDAGDFADAFKDQPHKLFEEVHIHKFTDKDSTSTQSLRIALEDIYGDYMNERTIKKNDAITIFISSHGITPLYDSTAFLIAGSDFDQLRSRSTSLDFEHEVLDILNQMPMCHKFLFIDACYSGAAANIATGIKSKEDIGDAQLSKAIARLAQSSLGCNTMVSCSAGEVSYEDASWGNGSFTKAINEALRNERRDIGKHEIHSDQNNDQILTMTEIYEYVRIRVPDIVKTKRPRPDILQTPYMSNLNVLDDKPFYILNRE